jgi:hypothetical protein
MIDARLKHHATVEGPRAGRRRRFSRAAIIATVALRSASSKSITEAET